jgi:hypothetical protein
LDATIQRPADIRKNTDRAPTRFARDGCVDQRETTVYDSPALRMTGRAGERRTWNYWLEEGLVQ